MDDRAIYRLLVLRGPAFPPVARALADLPADHPMKLVAEAATARGGRGQIQDRLIEIEARLAALESRP